MIEYDPNKLEELIL